MIEKLEQIPVSLDVRSVRHELRGGDWGQIQSLLEVANPLISGKAIYQAGYVEKRLEDAVVIDGICLRSRVLSKNLEKVGRVFPYIVTIGKELEERADASGDLLEKYYLDQIGNVALSEVRKYLETHLRSRFGLSGLSFMSPGSLGDWPIEEQGPLFSIFKGAEDLIGVRLTKSLVMIPKKSVSGIYFPTEVTFYSCQLCPRKNCEGRKARYNEDLAKEYGLFKVQSG